MKEEESQRDQRGIQGGSGSAGGTEQQQTGDPGRTPGKAEGDEQTVDEDLRRKEGQGRKA